MKDVDKGGQVLPLTRFVALTGVSRERLRAWERRFGFPEPVREGGGPRRYRLSDVGRVVAVREAGEAGVPLAVAVAASAPGVRGAPADAALGAALEALPVPLVLVAGLAVPRAVWANAAARALPAAPGPGEPLEGPCAGAAARLLRAPGPPVACEHPSWTGAARDARSVVFRVGGAGADGPLVAVAGLESPEERAAVAQLAERAEAFDVLRRRGGRHERWLGALADLGGILAARPGPDDEERALEVLVRRTQAVDGALLRRAAGPGPLGLALQRSRRGVLRAARLPLTDHAEAAQVLVDGGPAWLRPAAREALGVPQGLHASAVRVRNGGRTQGLLVLLFEEPEEHGEDVRRLLAAASGVLGALVARGA